MPRIDTLLISFRGRGEPSKSLTFPFFFSPFLFHLHIHETPPNSSGIPHGETKQVTFCVAKLISLERFLPGILRWIITWGAWQGVSKPALQPREMGTQVMLQPPHHPEVWPHTHLARGVCFPPLLMYLYGDNAVKPPHKYFYWAAKMESGWFREM